ncbi:MAG TPA: type II toxin-antitoxin system PemK/MazF family toxin [Syntrophobacteraceae bacterium]|nr:type II toxin-antitoxin system PemK/MazF family toxin [Syntrophobacteraceae bacterium]
MTIRRAEVYLAGLDPVIGREIEKTRPVVVVSNDLNNEFSGTVTVLPITSGGLEKIYPFEVLLPKGTANLPKDSKVKANQIRTLDRSRLVKFIGELPKDIMAGIDKAMMLHLGLE